MIQTPCQLELFPGFTAPGTRAPKLALPWTEKEEIDSRRAASILGVSHMSMQRILKAGCVRYYNLSGKESNSRILYESLVEYCDELRVLYMIPAKHQRTPGRRLRDDQVLPFPLTETVRIEFVATALHCSPQSILHLIESGDIVAYRLLIGTSRGHWRLHLPPVERHIAKLNRMAERRSSPLTDANPN